jgi:hypothetical protein
VRFRGIGAEDGGSAENGPVELRKPFNFQAAYVALILASVTCNIQLSCLLISRKEGAQKHIATAGFQFDSMQLRLM